MLEVVLGSSLYIVLGAPTVKNGDRECQLLMLYGVKKFNRSVVKD